MFTENFERGFRNGENANQLHDSIRSLKKLATKREVRNMALFGALAMLSKDKKDQEFGQKSLGFATSFGIMLLFSMPHK